MHSLCVQALSPKAILCPLHLPLKHVKILTSTCQTSMATSPDHCVHTSSNLAASFYIAHHPVSPPYPSPWLVGWQGGC